MGSITEVDLIRCMLLWVPVLSWSVTLGSVAAAGWHSTYLLPTIMPSIVQWLATSMFGDPNSLEHKTNTCAMSSTVHWAAPT